jgi:asparagine synthase (glutamine-hydrolysing)
MCGIAGVLLPRGAAIDSGLAADLGASLKHRGPDDLGFLGWDDETAARRGRDPAVLAGGRLALVHRRLSIIDRSEAGWQPMASPDGRYVIVFNGEIYNYRELRRELEDRRHVFASRSDTEVLLAAFIEWGDKALARLVGMFAFAVLDTVDRRLFLARDFFGIKPLYYTHWGGGFAFASEIKTLLRLPGLKPRAHAQRLYEYLRFGLSDRGGPTMFAGIEQLPPAHYLDVSLDRPQEARPVRYWRVEPGQVSTLSFEDAAAKLRELFLDAVRLHLRSDVAVGAALSGGIDSSATVMAMRHLQGDGIDLHTFSYIADDPGLSEEKWVDLVASAAAATVHKVRPVADDLVADLDRLIETQDEPFASTSIYAQHRVFRLAGEAGIKVTLDGQGADEYLAGYPTYVAARLASLLRRGKMAEALKFLRRAASTSGLGLTGVLLRAGGLLLPSGLAAPARRLVGESAYPRWLDGAFFAERGVTPPESGRHGRDTLAERLRETLEDRSLPALLRYADRNAMAFSVESRMPFLTPALVEFVLSLPEHYIIAPDGTTKAVFRRAMRGIVPDAVLDRRDKIGFVTPEHSWLDKLAPWVDRILTSEAAAAIPALDLEALRREWGAVRSGRGHLHGHVWRGINMIRWAERYDVSFAD